MDAPSILKHYLSKDPLCYIKLADNGNNAILPEALKQALSELDIPLIIFLNQAIVAGGDYEKLCETTGRFRQLYKEAVEKISKNNKLAWRMRPYSAYSTDFGAGQGAQLPDDVQLQISDTITEAISKTSSIDLNSGFDMHDGTKSIGNCFIACLYYLAIARRLGLQAHLRGLPQHVIICLPLANEQYTDPYNGVKRIRKTRVRYKLEDGLLMEVDYRKTQATDNYGIAFALSNKAGTLCDLERFRDAILYYDRALELNPNDPRVLNNKACALSQLGAIREALNCYDRVLKLNPRYYEALNNKAITLNDHGKFKAALDCCNGALRINPTNFSAWNSKAVSLEGLGRYGEATACCNEALRLNPESYEAWTNKAISLEKLHKEEEALTAYSRALELKPDYYNGWSYTAELLELMGRHKEAAKCRKKARELMMKQKELKQRM